MNLVTGGTGFIGSTLAKMLLDEGLEIATFDIKPFCPVLEPYGKRWNHFQGNLGNMGEVLTAVRVARPETIFHLGGMLSMPSEQNPQASFLTNVTGTYNVLEGARLFGVKQVIYASTNGTFGLDLEGLTVIDDHTLQRPFTMYGCGKLFGELLGRYYNRKYGVNFRSIRLPAVVGPGAKTKNVSIYNAWAIEKSFFGEPYEIFVTPETVCPVIYFKDAARAFLEISRSPANQIKTMNYIVVGVDPMPTAMELKDTILTYLPQAKLSFNPDPLAVAFQKMNSGVRWDETPAVKEWNWKAIYNLDEMIKDFIKELKEHTSWYA
jgi:nucleoside-diphosphate-sugar epimerase